MNTPAEQSIGILVISPAGADHTHLRTIARNTRWQILEAHSYRDAMMVLCNVRVPVVMCESHLPDGNWKDILSEMAPLANRPRLIVTSLLADHELWLEVLAMGGYDVLPKPFQDREVRRVLDAAYQDWQAERSRSGPVTAVMSR